MKKTKCLILSCGPSLSEITKEDVEKLSEDHIIATIKQSYLKFGEFSDFHFFNCNNIVKYEKNKAQMVCCSPIKPSSGHWENQKIDHFFHMSNMNKKLNQFNDLSEFFSAKNIGKFLGPGIMLEIVLPFVYNLGFKSITTVGWDYYKLGSQITSKHFYEEKERSGFRNPAALLYNGENEESIANSKRINEFFASQGVELNCVESKECYLHESINRIRL